MHAQRKKIMCVKPISALCFRAGKIELDAIHKAELSNFDSIKLLARQNFCDFLIEKRGNKQFTPDYDVFVVVARRKWIKPNYVYANEITSVHKNTPINDVANKIYEATKRAANAAKEQTLELAKTFIR